MKALLHVRKVNQNLPINMRIRYILFLLAISSTRIRAQEELPLFSDLANQPAFQPTFDALALGNDLYYLINDNDAG